MMDVLEMTIIWCDISFENEKSYQSMKDEFNETTTATSKKPLDPIDMAIFNEGKEELRSNNVPLITVQTADDAMREIEKHKDKKIFVICSGTVGRYLVPEIVHQYPYVHDFYLYTHNIVLHLEWGEKYGKMLKMFNFHTNLLVRLTRDIADYFIKRGQMFLNVNVNDSQKALEYFKHAQNLEIAANAREKIEPNSNGTEPSPPQPDFREHLDVLEGDNGLISQAETAIRKQEQPLQSS
jgi:dihydrofolate reductase